MNILMLGIKEYPYGISSKFEKFPGGGTARYIISLSEFLSEKNHIVYLIVRKMPRQSGFEEVGNLKIFRVNWINNRYLRLPSFALMAFFLSFKIIKKIDIIHAHGSFDILLAYFLSKLYNRKMAATPHGITSYQSQYKYNQIAVFATYLLEMLSFKLCPNLIYLSNDEKINVEKRYNLSPNQKHWIQNMGIPPVNVDRKHIDRFNILFIGRLVSSKGIDHLIQSLNHLSKDVLSNVKLILVGDGYERIDLEKLTSNQNLNPFVEFVGFTTDIGKYFSIASIFILPSRGGEGLPVTLLEALSCGVPCAISNFKMNILDDAIIYLDDNLPETLANVITFFYNNRIELDKISSNAKDVFNAYFSIKHVSEKYKNIYHSILESVL